MFARTERLMLRPGWPEDAPVLSRAIGDEAVVRNLARAPWIGLHRDDHGAVELGYWIARPYWGLGFATEAGRAVVDLAQESLRLDRLVAGHFLDNPASGHVLRKLGFVATGQMTTRASQARGCLVPFVAFELSSTTVEGVMPRLAA
jgi:hypothetical protein